VLIVSCILDLSTYLTEKTIFTLYNVTHICLRANLFLYTVLKKIAIGTQILLNILNTVFHDNPSGGKRVVPCGGTDGQAWQSH
jgi:hypothetical protein